MFMRLDHLGVASLSLLFAVALLAPISTLLAKGGWQGLDFSYTYSRTNAADGSSKLHVDLPKRA